MQPTPVTSLSIIEGEGFVADLGCRLCCGSTTRVCAVFECSCPQLSLRLIPKTLAIDICFGDSSIDDAQGSPSVSVEIFALSRQLWPRIKTYQPSSTL